MTEAGFTLYAHVDGSDLQADEETLMRGFQNVISSRSWVCGDPSLVNQRHEPDSSAGLGDLPDWDLGLNLSIPAVGIEAPGWFGDIQHIANSLAEMWRKTGHAFVIGMTDHDTGITEDLFYVESDSPGMDYL